MQDRTAPRASRRGCVHVRHTRRGSKAFILLRYPAALFVLGGAWIFLAAPAALGHAELEATKPATGANLDAAPNQVVTAFTERITNDSRLEVLDGCGNEVAGRSVVSDSRMATDISRGQPGRWQVDWQNVSADDGHPDQGTWGFEVAGNADCSGNGGGGPGPGGNGAGGPSDQSGGGFPIGIVIAVIAAAAVIGGALYARRRTTR